MLDLTQKELAQRAGCSVAALQKIESDERRPSRQLAERLVDFLEVPSDQRALLLKVARRERMTETLPPTPLPATPPQEESNQTHFRSERVSKIKDKQSRSDEKNILEKGVSPIVCDCNNTQRDEYFLPKPAFFWKNNEIDEPDVSDSAANQR